MGGSVERNKPETVPAGAEAPLAADTGETPAGAMRRSGLSLLLDRRREHWILASMLLVLHAALNADLGSTLSAALVTAHLGLFFLWQPIWQRDQRVDLRGAILIAIVIVAMVWMLNWWLLFAWLVALIGIVAGRSFSSREERYAYLLTLAFLVAELLVNCTAMLFFARPLQPAISQPFHYGLYLIPAVLYAIPPITAPQRDAFPVDFFRGITFALMTALLAVFSVLITLRLGIRYPLALVGMLMALGLFLLFLSWITTPGSGNIGLRAVWEKSVLNIGTPFEAWLGNIANLARQRAYPDEFLEAAISELVDIPWVSGAEWRSDTSAGIEGRRTRHHLTVDTDALAVTLYTERSFSSALLIHCRLLIQVLGHFYVAKQREHEQANAAHLRAIHETGARVTHDIKNLLQSLNTMTAAIDGAQGERAEQAGLDLLRRRLPDVAQRLQLALDKLRQPAAGESARIVGVGQWCHALEQRLEGSGITVEADLDDPDLPVPRDCLDSVVDNLVDNARNKVAAGRATSITVRTRARDGAVVCAVSDDGEALDAELVRVLFRQPVPSATGLGVGLYQAARQAELAGWRLTLAANRTGEVRFELARKLHQPDPGRAVSRQA